MNRAAGLQPDGNGGLDLEGVVSGAVDRGDKKAFERKMKAKQQNKQGDRRESTKAERDRLAKLLVFEDDVLGCALVKLWHARHAWVSGPHPQSLTTCPVWSCRYAFGLGSKWEGANQQLENGGQIIAFSNKEKPDKVTRIILVAQVPFVLQCAPSSCRVPRVSIPLTVAGICLFASYPAAGVCSKVPISGLPRPSQSDACWSSLSAFASGIFCSA